MDTEENRRNLRNAQQRLRRNMNSAEDALAVFDETGDLRSLAHFDIFADRAQDAAVAVNQCEALGRVLASQNVAH